MGSEILLRGKDLHNQNTGKGSGWVQDMGVYARRIELLEVGAVTTIYKGWAEYGSAENAAVWRMQKLTLDETAGFTLEDGQAGEGKFNQIWDDRGSLSYS